MVDVIATNEVHTPVEAAQLIGIGYATVYRWIKAGKLAPVRICGHTLVPKGEIDRLKNGRNHK